MGLSVKGFVPASMLDWDGRIVTTLFTGGCNLRCLYCHNPDLVLNGEKLEDIDFEIVERHLLNKKGWIDGVVISGGEPLMYKDLNELLRRIKSLGYKVKIDTNGTLPGVLEILFENKLVDYVAMDVKTVFAKYQEITGSEWHQGIKKSIKMIVEAEIEHEFRTTVVPDYVTMDDVLEIAALLKGGKAYFLQQFSSQHVLEPQVSNIEKYKDSYLLEMAEECSKYIPTKTRGIEPQAKILKAV